VLVALSLVDDQGQPVAGALRSCELRLDVWDDRVHVRIRDGARRRGGAFALVDDALRACGVVEDLSVAELFALARPGPYRLSVRVALDPVSPELLERTREFMSNPRGVPGGQPRALFSAVARLFRSETDVGGESFLFRTGPLPRPTEARRR
jgi:hypothetical protein